MGEEDDRKDTLTGIIVNQGGSFSGGRNGQAAAPCGELTPEGTAVCMALFKKVYLGLTMGESFRFPVIVGSDQQGRAWTGSYSIIADGPRLFEGRQLTRAREVMTLKANGGIPVISISTKYFEPDDSGVYKILFNSGVSYNPVSQCTLPSSPRVGDRGTLGTFQGSDGSTVTVSWALKGALHGHSVLEVSSEVTGDTETSREVDSYLLDPTGVPATITLRATSMDTTVTLSGDRAQDGKEG
ncbi:hypothetical protein [Geomonas sp.]|uniref:hypothetical protein n=1 Tax=Geomonas sp. TaxID=2651584 RepID=UPI002B461902|nr:hypothetical protein [Geomonas sp.]HJV34282.1 hypothetical protein [Geomonas sp.]